MLGVGSVQLGGIDDIWQRLDGLSQRGIILGGLGPDFISLGGEVHLVVFWFIQNAIFLIVEIPQPFLIGGGLGNIFDRALYGSVTDFLHIDFGLFQTGIFNMADVSVMVGVFTILLYSYFFKKPVEGTEVAP